MDILCYHFPVSGVETYLFVPPLVMFVISLLTSMGGLSGAFILMPFQMSVLGYTGPGASGTNLVYNVVSIPLGVYRHIREGRLAWPLFALLTLGTVPGMAAGYYVRVTYLPDPEHFRPFVGLVLAYMGIRMLSGVLSDRRKKGTTGATRPAVTSGRIAGGRLSLFEAAIDFQGRTYTFRTVPVFFLSLAVGVVGGIYGIGGGAIMAPFCISVLGLPVYIVSGASLFSSWAASIVAAGCYAFAPAPDTVNASPDWQLGALFGLGGMAGIYLGARLQKYVPTTVIRLILGAALLFIAVRYCWATVAGMLG
jgi:hypothetical protein